MKNIALIPARKGSKRIKNKNKRNFLGKPMILRPIDALNNMANISKIYVSSNDKDIKQIISNTYCKYFDRNSDLCDDHTTSIDVAQNFAKEIDFNFDHLIMVYPTTPNLDVESLGICLEKLDKDKSLHSAASVIKYAHPLERKLSRINDNYFFNDMESARTRTQDLKEYFHDAANFYIFKKVFFLSNGALFDGKTFGIEINRKYYLDIDTQLDWDFAEFLCSK